MKRHSLLLLTLLLLITLCIRSPSISEGLPYFYNEDEAHHFNRVVNMVKSGDLNPHYFHKPSLHFYLRIPVVAASFLHNVKNGSIRSVKEIITADHEGVGGYAFSASHPGIVKWNRALSVLLGLATVLLCYLIAFEVTNSRTAGIVALLFAAVSPELLRHGATIGVDVVMTFFCVLTTYIGVRCHKFFSFKTLALCGVCAGLAVSSKYNALPIVAVPLLVGLSVSRRRIGGALVGVFAALVGFFAGSPYIFAEIPLFLDQFAYEIWHYKIAGHEGHTGEPGMVQALFYLGWLKNDALGLSALVAALLGSIVIVPRYKTKGAIVLAAPLLFFLLMIDQRANFTRNMTLILPYLAIFIGIAMKPLFARSRVIGLAVLFIFLFFPFTRTLNLRADMKENVESRLLAEEWLRVQHKIDTGVLADIEFARSVLGIPGISKAQKTLTPIELYQEGFDRVVSNDHFLGGIGAQLEKEFIGISGAQRIVRNPHLKVWRFNPELFDREIVNNFLDSVQAKPVVFEPAADSFRCVEGTETYCWIKQRTTRLYIKDLQADPNFSGRDGLVRLSFNVMTPWSGQKVRFTFDDLLAFIDVPLKGAPGEWETVEVDLPYQELKSQGYFIVSLSEVHSPQSWSGVPDGRRLGLAVKDIRILSR